MTAPWRFTGEPGDSGALSDTSTLVEGSTFCISDAVGDFSSSAGATGLFVRDTRVLSLWQLRIDGERLSPLDTRRPEPFAGTYVTRVPPAPGTGDSATLVVRRRHVGNGMREDIEIRNLTNETRSVRATLSIGADFADVFEVKERRTVPRGGVPARAAPGRVRMYSPRDDMKSYVAITYGDGGASRDHAIEWAVDIAPHAAWHTTVEVVPAPDGVELPLAHPRDQALEHAIPGRRLRRWRRASPRVETADARLAAVLRQSIEDLGALRIFDPEHPERAVVAAGSPWFMALFGRDSLLTAHMLLPLDTGLALGTLQALAEHQGRRRDPRTEEQPGRILHELRFGPASAFDASTTYYGTADATPLFVSLAGELRRWGAPADELHALLPAVDRAVQWLDEDGDPDQDGFVEYEAGSESGLVNQGWKDSWDGISFADGRIPTAPIALAEVQAYSYAAFLARAELADAAADPSGAARWRKRAAELKRNFNESFWLPDREWFAVGLDRDKQPIDSLTSNIGHCLWTGIVDDDKAAAVSRALTSDEMFTG